MTTDEKIAKLEAKLEKVKQRRATLIKTRAAKRAKRGRRLGS